MESYINREGDLKKIKVLEIIQDTMNYIYFIDFLLLLIVKGVKRFHKEECFAV